MRRLRRRRGKSCIASSSHLTICIACNFEISSGECCSSPCYKHTESQEPRERQHSRERNKNRRGSVWKLRSSLPPLACKLTSSRLTHLASYAVQSRSLGEMKPPGMGSQLCMPW